MKFQGRGTTKQLTCLLITMLTSLSCQFEVINPIMNMQRRNVLVETRNGNLTTQFYFIFSVDSSLAK